jgi:hypothetical protein
MTSPSTITDATKTTAIKLPIMPRPAPGPRYANAGVEANDMRREASRSFLFMATSTDELDPRVPPMRLDDSNRNVMNGADLGTAMISRIEDPTGD